MGILLDTYISKVFAYMHKKEKEGDLVNRQREREKERERTIKRKSLY